MAKEWILIPIMDCHLAIDKRTVGMSSVQLHGLHAAAREVEQQLVLRPKVAFEIGILWAVILFKYLVFTATFIY